MNREEFDKIFQKLIPEMSRYLYVILASKRISQTRITPKDVINDTYIKIVNRKNTYNERKPNELKGYILQSLKWDLHRKIYQINRSFTLIEVNGYSDNDIIERINNKIEESNPSNPDFAYLDSKIYENIIKTYSNKKWVNYYLDYVTMRDVNKEADIDLHKRLRIKYNVTVKETNLLMTSVKSFIKYNLKKLKKTKRKNVFKKPVSSISKITYQIDNLSSKQKKVRDNVKRTMVLYNKNKNMKVTEMSKILNIPRPTIYFYIKLGKNGKY